MRKHQAGMQFSLANIPKEKAKVAGKYDKDKKGYLTFPELSELFVAEKKGVDTLRPEDMKEALEMIGLEDLWPHYLADWTPVYNYQCCVDWRGNFHIDGVGAGSVKTGRRVDYSSGTELFVVCVVLDLFSTDYLLENLNEANVIIGPWGFPSGASTYDANVTYCSRWRLEIFSRFYTEKRIYPNQLQVTMKLADAVALSSAQGLSLYGMMELGAVTKYVNRDGLPFANFDIPRSSLGPSGTA